MARFYAFGPFRLDAASDTLVGPHGPVALGQRACVLLRTLVSQPGVLVTKSDVDGRRMAWPGRRGGQPHSADFGSAKRHSQTPQAVDNGSGPSPGAAIGSSAKSGSLTPSLRLVSTISAAQVPPTQTGRRSRSCRSKMPEVTPRRAMSATALPQTSSLLCHDFPGSSSSPRTLRSGTGATRWTSGRSLRNLASVTCSKAAFGMAETASEFPSS